ncbi:homoserine kinase [Nakamurella panacisegetis]|uniref:Homoserine kinase n=1 Tax=Nakamurella panacisegetis TaxID=1090615 RepID=A0A1H0SR60_9ACTN|nr:homoserine kinase [Nakamurella panacisegetis]SDP43686.1 homoserine kinase [Nakamurella panacisegetis]
MTEFVGTAADLGAEAAATVTVRVPATSANLGPGYDCFGLAIERYDEAVASLSPSGLRVDVEGIGAGEVPTDGRHLVVRAMALAWATAGLELPGVHLRCRNRIPHGGGQGSSAAAIVAGLLLGRGLLPTGTALTDDDILQLAHRMEGHPDNVAPALLGGFTLAWTRADGTAAAVRREVHPDVRAVVFTASQSSSTHHSRALLPQQVPHVDAAANVAAAALMVHALTTDPGYLLEATGDRLHQPYRAGAMPESAALMQDLRSEGIAAVISGAGPSVLALVRSELDLNRWRRPGFVAAQVPVCTAGATVTTDRSARPTSG